MVASVGPYKFSNSEAGAASCHAWAMVSSSGSPQNKLNRKLGSEFGFSVRIFCMNMITEGTENHMVNCFSRINRDGEIKCA